MNKNKILNVLFVFFLSALLGSNVYADVALMLGSFKNKDNAEKYIKAFMKQQSNGRENAFLEEIHMPGKGIWYRVCLGPFSDREKALNKQKTLQNKGNDSVVVSVKTENTINRFTNSSGSDARAKVVEPSSDPLKSKPPSLVPPDGAFTRVAEVHSQGALQKAPIPYKAVDEVKSKAVPSETNSKSLTKDRISKDRFMEASREDPIVYAGDVLKIKIPEQKQMSREYDVDPDGRIFFISVGEIEVSGLSISLVGQKIAQALKQILPKSEKPVVDIVESMRYVNISGGVSYPGWYRVPQLSNLDDLVEMAGGLVGGVDFSAIKIRRQTKTGSRELRVSSARVSLEPNDTLVVPTPKKYERRVDSGDLLFINAPMKTAETTSLTDLSEIEKKVSQNKIEVDQTGYIYVPDYGHIYVKNLLPSEIGKIIASRLPKYLARSAKVQVNIIEKKHYVQLSGHVARPGWYNIPESDNIQGALSAAGGAEDGAIMSRVMVTRKWGGQVRKVRVNLYQYTVTGDVRLLTPIHESDSIFVPISSAFGDVKRTLSAWMPPASKLEEDTGTKVRIFGAVTNPGVYEPTEDMNILDLIIKAGGNSVQADLGKVVLIREDKTRIFDLNDLITQSSQGMSAIPKIQNGDAVYITYFKQAGQEATEPKKMVRIFGGVKDPGVYDPVQNMNLMDIFSMAKGGTYDADLSKVMVLRRSGTMEHFDLQEYLDAKDPNPSKLPSINPSDTVYVAYLQHLNLEKKEPIYLLGKVKTPGQYDLAEGGMTVYQMLAYAGGLDEWADTENIRIIRMVSGRQRNIPYNLRKALSGKYPELNIRLRSFDTIYVP